MDLNLGNVSDADLEVMITAIRTEQYRRVTSPEVATRRTQNAIAVALTPMVEAINAWLDRNSHRLHTESRAVGSGQYRSVVIYCPAGTIRESEQMVREVTALLDRAPWLVRYTVQGPSGSPGTTIHVTEFADYTAGALAIWVAPAPGA